MSRVAAIDCGTNSLRLLIADVDPAAGTLTDVAREMQVVRLGAGVDRTGRLSDDALARTFAALRSYAAAASDLGAEAVRMVATSATRDAANRADFVAGCLDVLGVEPEVVSGEEEAALSFAGATRELAGDGTPAPFLVVDIGGGSTEFVLGGDRVQAARSVDVGCVRLTERHIRSDPPLETEVAAVVRDVDAALADVARTVPLQEAATLVAVAGTATTVAAIALGLTSYDASRIHRARITAVDVAGVVQRLRRLDAPARAAIPVMHPGRVDIIVAGALVLDRVVTVVGVPEVLVSEHDILDGIAWSLAEPSGQESRT